MKLYQPSTLHHFLDELGLSARKSLSQHFLIDGNIIRKIIQAAELFPDDYVIEIGPGPGALTEALLDAGVKVLAIEMDHRFATALSRLQTPDARLEVIQADFLTFPLQEHLREVLKGKKAKVVANLPYQITTPILAKLLPLHAYLSSLTVMVQKEVGQRFVAHKGTSDYSSFTLFLQYYATTSYCFTVKPTCFSPPPKVHSAVMRCLLHPPPPVQEESSFFSLIRTAFQHRRKMLRASLKELYSPQEIEASLQSIHLNPQARPETLCLQEFIAFYEQISRGGEPRELSRGQNSPNLTARSIKPPSHDKQPHQRKNQSHLSRNSPSDLPA